MLNINEIVITEQNLRYPQQIAGMLEFLKNSNKFEQKIICNKFEDGQTYLLDGHHRVSSIFLSGREYLLSEEISFINYTYDQFLEICFLDSSDKWLGWVTPFDPRVEARICDTRKFKDWVKHIYYHQSPMHAEHYIKTNKDLYCEKRDVSTIQKLILNSMLPRKAR